MQYQFPLFHRHIDLAHFWWERLLKKGDIVVDATCGNGNDTLFLAQRVLSKGEGEVWAFDLQELALEKTKSKLEMELSSEQMQHVRFVQGSHADLPKDLQNKKIKLAVYNLGYLPGSDKLLATHSSSTIASLTAIAEIIQPGGAICLTCYIGHTGGKEEQDAVVKWASGLPKDEWNVCFHQWINMRAAPGLVLIQRCFKSYT